MLSSVQFQGIKLATYSLPASNLQGRPLKAKEVSVYQLETKDLPLVESLIDQAEAGTLTPRQSDKNDPEAHKVTTYNMLDTAYGVLLNQRSRKAKHKDKDAVIWLAVSERKPCGMIIGNMAMRHANGLINNSYRPKPAGKETELDWLATWPAKATQNIYGVGKILVSHFFQFCNTKNIKQIYVRSNIPEEGVALDFYRSMGFRQLTTEPVPCDNPDGPRAIAYLDTYPDYKLNPSPVYEMVTPLSEAQQIHKGINERFKPTFHFPVSVPAESFADF